MIYKPASLEFVRKRFRYNQVTRENNVAIYRVTALPCTFRKREAARGFEVVVLKTHNGFTRNYGSGDVFVEPAEMYPGDEMWGTYGFSYENLTDALKKYNALLGKPLIINNDENNLKKAKISCNILKTPYNNNNMTNKSETETTVQTEKTNTIPKLRCIVTGKERITNRNYLEERAAKIGSIERYLELYISRDAVRLLRQGKTVAEVRQALNSTETAEIAPEILAEALKINGKTGSVATTE